MVDAHSLSKDSATHCSRQARSRTNHYKLIVESNVEWAQVFPRFNIPFSFAQLTSHKPFEIILLKKTRKKKKMKKNKKKRGKAA